MPPFGLECRICARRGRLSSMTDDEPADGLAVEIGQRLLWLRLLSGKTQDQMVTAAAQGRWSRWENGERVIPPHVAIDVCNRFRVSMDYIYRGSLIGVHPDLATALLERYPGRLIPPPFYTGYTDPPDSDRDDRPNAR